MFGLSYSELLICGVVAVLLFGNRLPSVARSLGRSMTEFKKGMSGIQDEWNEAVYSEPQDSIQHEDREAPTGDAFAPPEPATSPEEPARTAAP